MFSKNNRSTLAKSVKLTSVQMFKTSFGSDYIRADKTEGEGMFLHPEGGPVISRPYQSRYRIYKCYTGRSDVEGSFYFRLEESKAQTDSSLTGPEFSVLDSGDLVFSVAGIKEFLLILTIKSVFYVFLFFNRNSLLRTVC